MGQYPRCLGRDVLAAEVAGKAATPLSFVLTFSSSTSYLSLLYRRKGLEKKILFVIAAPVSALRNPLYLLTTPLSEEIPLKFLQGLAAFQLSLCTFLPLCMSPS